MPAVVDPQKCHGCGSCVDECATEAIAILDEKAQINEEECIDCGMCVSTCPQEAISQ